MLVLGVKVTWEDGKNSMCGIFAASIILGLVRVGLLYLAIPILNIAGLYAIIGDVA